MKIFLFLAFVALAQANDIHQQWEKFKADYGKVYENGKEHARRFGIFKNNLMLIEEHNKLYNSGDSTFYLAINKFADMTNQEFVAQMNGNLPSDVNGESNQVHVADVKDLPDSVDWRTKGYVTPIKDQGMCGSCWAFSASGAIEAAHFKKTKKLVSLSEQNLVDCVKTVYGCEGGYPFKAFEYVIQNKGIDTEASYPYQGIDEDCKYKPSGLGATISSYKDIKKGSEEDLTSALANVGPISVAIDASNDSFQFYSGGVYNEPSCSTTALDHAVLAVGYGSDKGNDYYIVKNSWGTGWGNKGYIWMSRNKSNQCGIATQAAYAIA